MKNRIPNLLLALAMLATCNLQPATARAQGTAFTYQGRLNDGGSPAGGIYDLRFAIYDATTNGNVYGVLTNATTGITNGLFTVALDFGGVFNGSNYWLEIAARTNGGTAFSPLSPRQPITSTPYAIYSANAGSAATAVTAGTAGSANSVSAANIAGTIQVTQLPGTVLTNNQSGVILNGTFTGDGGGLTNLPAASLTGTVADSLLSSNIARLNIPNTNLQATASVVLDAGGSIIDTTNLFGGAGYTNNPLVTVTDVSGSNAVITATVSNGVVTGLSVQNPGTNYSSGATLTIAPPPSNAYQTFGSGNIFNGVNTFNNPSNTFAGTFTGNGSGLDMTGPSAISGLGNEAIGYLALAANTTGSYDTANGVNALAQNTTGSGNEANGYRALYSNTIGSENTANGSTSLYSNTTGNWNTANGVAALHYNTTGSYNSANGGMALYSNQTGSNNTANGYQALFYNTTGSNNVANGGAALFLNTTGSNNTANGYQALYKNTTGGNNIAEGFQAGYNVTGSSNIDIGNMGLATDTNIIRIGSGQTQSFIAGIYGANVIGVNSAGGPPPVGVAVYVTSSGQLGTINVAGSNNTASGGGALIYNTTGSNNTANGYQALYSNTTGNNNVANGDAALYSNTTGTNNTANGYQALYKNTTGGNNAANGYQALYSNTTGSNNVANGSAALYSNTTGSNNTANGYQALYKNTTGGNYPANAGSYNIAEGYQAGYNITGSSNIDIGNMGLATDTNIIRIGSGQTQAFMAGIYGANLIVGNPVGGPPSVGVAVYVTSSGQLGTINVAGSNNTASGVGALIYNTTGSNNTANGYFSLHNNRYGSYNIAEGYQAGYNITGSSNIDIGNMGSANDANIIRIGSGQKQAFIAGQIIGDGSGLTNLNVGQLPRAVLTNNESGVALSGAFSGDGSGLTNLNPANLSAGTAAISISGNAATATTAASVTGNIADAQLSANVALLNGTNSFTGTNNFAGTLLATNANNVISGTFTGSGAGLANVPAAAITGGLTINLAVLVPGGGTNILCFTNGILQAIQ
jgi:hypothetical protein